MRAVKYTASTLKELLQSTKVATLIDLKSALDTNVNMTVFRKLKELSYVTSYSHSGKFYTLPEIAVFDVNGIWSHNSVMFSIRGNLKNTVQDFIENSIDGYSAFELKTILNIKVKEPLLNLVRKKQLYRKKIQGRYVYFSKISQTKKVQILCRNNKEQELKTGSDQTPEKPVSDKIKEPIFSFFATLNEKQSRLFAGLESLRTGYGGDKKVAMFLGIDPHTVAKGRSEIISGNVDINRIRKQGGGRIPAEKKTRK